MSKFANAALAATLALAAVPALAIGTAAHAQPAHTVRVADLDLSSPEGVAAFDARVDKAARQYCREQRTTGTRLPSQTCIEAVRAEMKEKAAAVAIRDGWSKVASR